MTLYYPETPPEARAVSAGRWAQLWPWAALAALAIAALVALRR